MARFLSSKEASAGMAPGSAIFIGVQKMDEAHIRVVEYDTNTHSEARLNDIEELTPYLSRETKKWINVDGLHDVALVQKIGNLFGLHPLLIEDILNMGQRPKFEAFDNACLVSVKMLVYDETRQLVISEHVSIVFGNNFIITFQEQRGDVFDTIRARVAKSGTRMRKRQTDYMAYAILDTIIDHYLIITELIGDEIEDLEGSLSQNVSNDIVEKINGYKTEIIFLRKVVRPVKELALQFLKSESSLVHKTTVPFLRDMLDLIMHTSETVDSYRDILSDQLSIHHTLVSSKLNETMRVLTIFSVIFIPLTFIAGIYGTNFEHMPEIKHHYGYPAFWVLLLVVAASMFLYFKKKKWM